MSPSPLAPTPLRTESIWWLPSVGRVAQLWRPGFIGSVVSCCQIMRVTWRMWEGSEVKKIKISKKAKNKNPPTMLAGRCPALTQQEDNSQTDILITERQCAKTTQPSNPHISDPQNKDVLCSYFWVDISPPKAKREADKTQESEETSGTQEANEPYKTHRILGLSQVWWQTPLGPAFKW